MAYVDLIADNAGALALIIIILAVGFSIAAYILWRRAVREEREYRLAVIESLDEIVQVVAQVTRNQVATHEVLSRVLDGDDGSAE